MNAIEILLQSLIRLRDEDDGRWIIGFSGGIDSRVLLHLLGRSDPECQSRVIVAHVDHGLDASSSARAARCAAIAAKQGLSFRLHQVDETPPKGASVEAWARHKRYEFFDELVGETDKLLIAQHADDQIETMFLQLLRGAGPKGLSAMAQRRRFGQGELLRPMLDITRAQIDAYANAHGLDWIVDPSNDDDRFDRNYLRHKVMPLLRERWPQVHRSVGRSAQLQNEAMTSLNEIADELLERALSADPCSIEMEPILRHSAATQAWVLRRWLERCGADMPNEIQLLEIRKMLYARVDATPVVKFGTQMVRRFRERLFCSAARAPVDLLDEYSWHIRSSVDLPHGTLVAKTAIGPGLLSHAVGLGALQVRFRRGGERCHPSTRAHSQSLKRMMQFWGVPPWQRFDWPLIYRGDDLVAVAGLCVCKDFATNAEEAGWNITWRPSTS